MNIKKLYKLHNILLKELGDDLVISLVVSEGKKLLAISTHKSLQSFKTGRTIQTCQLNNYDLTHDIDTVAQELIVIYSAILYDDPKKKKKKEKIHEIM